MSGYRIRPALPDDARDLARLSDIADHGLPRLFWARDGETDDDAIWDVGEAQFRGDTGRMTFRNAFAAEQDGACLGAILSYPLDIVDPPDAGTHPDIAPLWLARRPLAGGHYVDFLACYPPARGRGIGQALLEQAEARARRDGAPHMGLLLMDDNETAARLYSRMGYVAVGSQPLAQQDWKVSANSALAMKKLF